MLLFTGFITGIWCWEVVDNFYCIITGNISFKYISGIFLVVLTFLCYQCLSERQVAILGSALHTSFFSVVQLRVSAVAAQVRQPTKQLFTFHVYFPSGWRLTWGFWCFGSDGTSMKTPSIQQTRFLSVVFVFSYYSCQCYNVAYLGFLTLWRGQYQYGRPSLVGDISRQWDGWPNWGFWALARTVPVWQLALWCSRQL